MRVHRFAVAAALATFCLLIAGGLVSTTESGLACPDWPLCEGRFIPRMVNGKQFEHTHRLIASFVATMTFGLCALVFKHRRSDKRLKGLAAFAVLLVVCQALLGALTVKLRLPAWVSSTHQATAMLFFSVAVTLAFWTRQRLPPSNASTKSRREAVPAAALKRLVLLVGGVVYAQIVSGAVMRHVRGGLACGFEFPLCLGQPWPLHGHFGVQAHMVHRVGGMLAGLAVLWLALRLFRARVQNGRLFSAALTLVAIAQVSLGIWTVLASRNLVIMTVHSSLGAGLLALLVSVYWTLWPSQPAEKVAVPTKTAVVGWEPA